ncbi:hypothetical protein [Streptomyces longispororuber]|uniref:hypothetical protein n=1 Tax=Streptomyces longispororuber TaxID=68230 RepID=UPI002109011E|nr:hypothetical protein [Streptomyces longispororuber]MCQ4207402.1 hypothetical protein [Streptomyces longispororuber]
MSESGEDDWRHLPPPSDLGVDAQEFLQALRLYMGYTNLSLRAFGKKHGYDPGTVSRYLSGKRPATSVFLRDLLKAAATAGQQVGESDRARLEHLQRRSLADTGSAASKDILRTEFAQVSREFEQQADTLEQAVQQLALARIEVSDHTERIRQLTESLALKEHDIRALEAQLAEHRREGIGQQELRDMTDAYERARAEADILRTELSKTRTLLREAEQRLEDSRRGMEFVASKIGRELREQEAAHKARVRELESRLRSLQEVVNRSQVSDSPGTDDLDARVPGDLPIDPRLQNDRVGAALRQLLAHARSPGLSTVSQLSSVPLGDVQRMFIHNEVRDEEKLRAVAVKLAERAGRPQDVREIMDLWQAGSH